jgi:hypothetical protein
MGTAIAVVAMTLALLISTSCVELRQEVPITPGVAPAELLGASWEDLPVTYCVPEQPGVGFVDHETLLRLVAEAFAAWGVPAEIADECSGGVETGNGLNEIGWGRLPAAASPGHKAGETSIRFLQTLGGGQADITEADIVIEARPPAGLETEECLYATLLHETGHFLGAHHIAPPAIMAPALTSCPQELTQADLDMVALLYPPPQ